MCVRERARNFYTQCGFVDDDDDRGYELCSKTSLGCEVFKGNRKFCVMGLSYFKLLSQHPTVSSRNYVPVCITSSLSLSHSLALSLSLRVCMCVCAFVRCLLCEISVRVEM